MKLRVEQSFEGDVAVLRLSGRMMASQEMYALRDQVKALIRDGHPDVLADFTDVASIDSAGLGLLITAHYSLAREGGRMKVCAPNERVRGVFYVTLLHQVLDVYPTRDEALASFGRG